MHTTLELTQPCQLSESHSCCGGPAKSSSWVEKVDLICRIALAVFSAIVSPLFFGAALAAGVILGTSYAITCYIQKKSLPDLGDKRPICAQGFMNYLSGMNFPPVVNSVVTAAFISAHVRHDPNFFVPFVGLFVGVWLGCRGTEVTRDLGCRLFTPL